MATVTKVGASRISVNRRFTLMDGMVLIAATAMGFGWLTALPWEQIGTNVLHVPNRWDLEAVWEFSLRLILIGTPLILSWTLALAILGLRSRGLRFRRRASRPGVAASLSASFCAGVVVLLFTTSTLFESGLSSLNAEWLGGMIEVLGLATPIVGLGVAVSWMTLALSGRWRAERSWLDRAGRLLGVYWLVLAPVLGLTVLLQFGL